MTDKTHDSHSEKAAPSPAPAPRKMQNPADHAEHIPGPLSDDAIHKTESKDKHPQGKTRHGGRDA